MTRTGVSLAIIASLMASQAFAAAAPAARLASVDGPVLVNQGGGFAPVTEATVLHPGDRLLSLRGAHAHLIYANGCAVSLKANAMLTVAEMAHGASCKVANSLVSDTDFTGDVAPAVGAVGLASTAGGLSTTTLVVVGVGVVTGTGLGIAAGTGALGGTTSS